MRRSAEDIIAEREDLPAAGNWQARLALGFADDAGTTRLVERCHAGPLRVQKPLYPEGPSVCHAVVVHPPGGVVGGDSLAISAETGAGAHAFITTPGAAKWYRANGRVSSQEVRITVGASGSLEWLPQETIFFDAAHVRLEQTVTLETDASFIGCDILCFGRTASGESFNSGRIVQRTTIRRGGRLVWFEQGALEAGAAMASPLAIAGRTVCATLTAVGKPLPAALVQAIREQGEGLAGCSGNSGSFGATQFKPVFVARYLGDSSEAARKLMMATWQQLRPHLIGREAVMPRIWNT